MFGNPDHCGNPECKKTYTLLPQIPPVSISHQWLPPQLCPGTAPHHAAVHGCLAERREARRCRTGSAKPREDGREGRSSRAWAFTGVGARNGGSWSSLTVRVREEVMAGNRPAVDETRGIARSKEISSSSKGDCYNCCGENNWKIICMFGWDSCLFCSTLQFWWQK